MAHAHPQRSQLRALRLARRARLALAALPLLLALGGCPTGTPRHLPRLGELALTCQPEDALVYVDDRYQGSVLALRQAPLSLPEGAHRLEVRRDGYFTHYAEVTVVHGVRQRLQVQLRKEPY